ncbi:DUF1800 domain-containing protein [Stieleria varia]|nr:DUF1800 family protein [Stieleria varia]
MNAKIQASQFLSKATFGPDEASIEALADRILQIGNMRAFGEWIDQQFELPVSSQEQVARDIIATDGREPDMANVGIQDYRYQAWWHIALTGEDQLRQRVAYALSQIFVIGDSGAGFNNNAGRDIGGGEQSIPDWLGMSNYYDMLAAGASGSYRDLLGQVTYHPCMGVWLSSVRNLKSNVALGRYPDENYAREIMQLFSVGLYELHQDGRPRLNANGELIPTYDNDQIKELARVFTGMKYYHNGSNSFYTGLNLGDPMMVDQSQHDNNYNYAEDPNVPGQVDPNERHSKIVFGVTLDPLPVPMTNEDAKAEIDQALDVVANHPNVAPFICIRLIQRLVKSNPSRGYVRRVTRVFNNNGQGQRGDLKAVVKAILTDPELFAGQRTRRLSNPPRVEVITRGTEYSRMKEPILRITGMIRALRPSSDYPNGYMMLSRSIESDLGQMPYRSPTVFNYYLPDYQPPGALTTYVPSRRNPFGALYAPEFQILTAVTANRTLNRMYYSARNRYMQYGMRVGTCRITFDLDEEIEMAKDLANMEPILQRFDLLLCHGSLSEETKTIIKDAIAAETLNQNTRNVGRLEEALLAVLISPDCVIEE